MDNPSAEREASLRATQCCPPSSMWWWTRWSATGNTWWWNGRGGDSIDEDGDVAQTAERTIQEQDDGRRHAEEGHARLTVKAELFYVDDGLVASTYPGWLQSPFRMLTGMFNRVGLRKNLCKTVGVVCRPCRAAGVRADKAYTHQMTGEGRIFKERQR